MADTTTVQLRMTLQGYEQQLLAARRLARFQARCRVQDGLEPQDPDPAPKRRLFVEKVARELYDTLVFTGSENPVAEEIRKELGAAIGRDVRFIYPPGGRLRIVAVEGGGARPLTDEEQRLTRRMLWRITRRKVDRSMLERPT
ncbi:MAG: hypothetical protein LBB60_04325 [Desulfovibrio sp.]|jgi:hypothetical protein|nr:hypothetical protein [Desulfovibrio sp.]